MNPTVARQLQFIRGKSHQQLSNTYISKPANSSSEPATQNYNDIQEQRQHHHHQHQKHGRSALFGNHTVPVRTNALPSTKLHNETQAKKQQKQQTLPQSTHHHHHHSHGQSLEFDEWDRQSPQHPWKLMNESPNGAYSAAGVQTRHNQYESWLEDPHEKHSDDDMDVDEPADAWIRCPQVVHQTEDHYQRPRYQPRRRRRRRPPPPPPSAHPKENKYDQMIEDSTDTDSDIDDKDRQDRQDRQDTLSKDAIPARTQTVNKYYHHHHHKSQDHDTGYSNHPVNHCTSSSCNTRPCSCTCCSCFRQHSQDSSSSLPKHSLFISSIALIFIVLIQIILLCCIVYICGQLSSSSTTPSSALPYMMTPGSMQMPPPYMNYGYGSH